MKKKGAAVIIVLLLLWIVLAAQINNEFMLPLPFDVFKQMLVQLTSPAFYQAIVMSLYRSLSGLAIAYGCALLLGLLCGYYRWLAELFAPIYLILKSIPNISYILIALIWTNNETAVRLICFMILFPMIYANVLSGIKSIDQDLLDVARVYPESMPNILFRVYLPLILPYLKAALSTGAGLAFKVGVMAEIIGSGSPGIGRQLQICRSNMDMSGLFAWTLWIILLLAFTEFISKKIMKYLEKREI